MKLAYLFCAPAIALAATALAAAPPASINNSKSNSYRSSTFNNSKSNSFRIDPRDPDGEKHCVMQGGTAAKDRDGAWVCTLPSAGPAEATTVNSSKSNNFRAGNTISPQPAEATTVSGSKSNTDARWRNTTPATPANASTVNSSKSNSADRAANPPNPK